MSALFVTGTGTDIGKTFVCAGLIRTLRAAGRSVHALKPVLSGFDTTNAAESDAAVILAALGQTSTMQAIEAIAPWRYAAPLAPNMAARLEGRTLDFEELVKFTRGAMHAHADAALLVEGVGGLMVPLDERHTVLDWIERLDIPTVLVAGSALGAISSTLTCLEVLHQRGRSPAAVLINESENGVDLPGTIETVAAFARKVPVLALRRAAHADQRAAIFERILAAALPEETRGSVHSTA